MANPPKSTEIPKEETPVDDRITTRFDKVEDAIDDIRSDVKHLDKTVGFIGDTNKFILVVLFATFLVIIVAIGLAIIAAHKITIKL